MIQAAAIGIWCSVTLLSSDDAVVHMICLSVTTGIVAGGAGRAYGRPSIFHLQAVLQFGPAVVALALRGTPYYIAMSVVSAAFLLAVMQLSANLHRIFMRAVVAREREAALAGQFDTALNNMPHGLCMFGADGRLAVMNHRFSEMMNLPDDLVHRGASASDIVDACVARRIDFGGQRQDDPRGDREFAGEGHRHHRSRSDPGPVAVLDVSADGRRRRRRAARGHHRAAQRRGQDQPSGALRRTDRASQPGQFPRRDRAPAGGSARRRPALGAAVHRPRSVQAGQRHARPSLRRPVAVRRRRPAARDAAPGGFRGALRRRRIRGVPAEHPLERGRRRARPAHRRSPERALQDRQSSGRDRRQRRHRDDVARASAPIRC